MNDSHNGIGQEPATRDETERQPAHAAKRDASIGRKSRFGWIKPIIQPVLFLAFGSALLVALGMAQKLGWISASGGESQAQVSTSDENVRYICPMMCTPPQAEPGRCPVCAMELVQAAAGGGSGDSSSIQVDPAARRVANIRTVAVSAVPPTRRIRAIGEIGFDEGTLKTISAYVGGRLDRLYADYTGVVVQKGDHLALVYSPRLYSSQVEYLLAKRSRENGRSATLRRVTQSNSDLDASARERLIELGMTAPQIEQLEKADKANSRMHLCAPISGTVIEKYAVEGQYVDEGQAIYRLADLSTVWLMLELFPEDAAAVRYGQKVTAYVQSQPGRDLSGRVAFIAPTVDPKTRTVDVRVVIANENGRLRVGDYAKATIDAPLAGIGGQLSEIYDPELAGKWISPRHPHIVESAPGECRVCGIDLVPARQFGFADEPVASGDVLVVPRSAVLMAGDNSVVYVETDPGRFEIRPVMLGPSCADQMVILAGVEEGEQVATSGNFLIDSQMQLAGNPSLIDPTKAEGKSDDTDSAEVIAALSELSEEDRVLAENQKLCPVTMQPLGSMGTPTKVNVNGKHIFLCCKGCEKRFLSDPDTYLANLAKTGRQDDDESRKIAKALAGLSDQDRALAEKQRICPVADYPLGSMGTPRKVDVNGTTVFICCEGCRESLLEEPDKYLAKIAESSNIEGSLDSLSQMDSTELDFPPIGTPMMVEPGGELPGQVDSETTMEESREIERALAELSPVDRARALDQQVCPVTDMPLGSMGAPVKVRVNGQSVFICCEGCRESLLAKPEEYVGRLPKEDVR